MRSPLDVVSWPSRTERLNLRRAIPDDDAATWRFEQLESVSRWHTAAPSTFEEYRARFRDAGRLSTSIVVELDGEVIGHLKVCVEDAWSQAEVADRARGVQAELGWSLDPSHTGKGFATEAVNELLRMCFNDLDLRRVTANCFAANVASWRLMERVGMRREVSTLRESLHRSGEWLDGLGYALLAQEWHTTTSRPAIDG